MRSNQQSDVNDHSALITGLILAIGYVMLGAGFIKYKRLEREVRRQEDGIYEEFLKEMEYVGEGKDKHYVEKNK